MKHFNTFVIAYAALIPLALAKADYSAGCNDDNMGESMCVGIGHRNLKRCYKGMWRVYACPKGCIPVPFAQCSTYEFSWMVQPSTNLTIATNTTLPANLSVTNNSTKVPVHKTF